MGGGCRTAGHFVDVDELELRPIPTSAKREATHPSKSVDPDPRRHAPPGL
jgi:hypothetical protein